MTARATTIWVCDRCSAEKEQHGSCPWNAHIWFRVGQFEIGEMYNAQLKDSKLLCEKCATELHEWWNQGVSSQAS